jgi:N-acetylmuramidase
MEFGGKGRPLSEAGMQGALSALDMDPAADMPVLWALITVESRGFGFLSEGRRPKILFERHIFHKETGGRFASEVPDLSAKKAGGYIGGSAEYERLGRAIALCRQANLGDDPALRSASWGLGQVMGFNAVASGFARVADMVARMADSEDAQLAGMAGFIRSEELDARLRSRDWTAFAKRYNGPQFFKNQYDIKLREAFEKFSSGISRDLRARIAQAALLYLGFRPGEPDGVVGQNTRRAIAAFRDDAGLGAGEALDEATFAALMQRAGFD